MSTKIWCLPFSALSIWVISNWSFLCWILTNLPFQNALSKPLSVFLGSPRNGNVNGFVNMKTLKGFLFKFLTGLYLLDKCSQMVWSFSIVRLWLKRAHFWSLTWIQGVTYTVHTQNLQKVNISNRMQHAHISRLEHF